MSFVSVIFNYVLRCINGGLLNVTFTPEYNATSNEAMYEFGMNQERLMRYVKELLMISGDDLPLKVLETFPASIGGDEAGVKEARKNPNREVIFIIGPVVAAILMLIAIIGLILIHFCTSCKECCHGHKTMRQKRGGAEVQNNGETRHGPSSNRQFDNDYDEYALHEQKFYSDSEGDSSDSVDCEPKGFVESRTIAIGDMVEERQGEIMDKIEEVAQRSEFVQKKSRLVLLRLPSIHINPCHRLCDRSRCVCGGLHHVRSTGSRGDENTLKDQVAAWLGNKSAYCNFPGTVLLNNDCAIHDTGSPQAYSFCLIWDELSISLLKFDATAVVYPVGSSAQQVIVTYFNELAAPVGDLQGQLDGMLNMFKLEVEDTAKKVLWALLAPDCSSSGLVPRFFGWALAVTLFTLFSFLSFVGLFSLWCIQLNQIKRFYDT
ncbi:unnamed protein product [Taenia asiatica]|uniref:Protein tweety homolog n=1 Tax=Taenia asiatica TaxID=60517 RepID=A0A158R8U5_TAEAS|nr:unnamed protein product [Taenia asiatica]